MLFCQSCAVGAVERSSSSYTKLRFILKGHGHLNKKRIFRLDYLKTPSNIPIFFDQFEYRIENADTNIKLFLYYIAFCLHFFV